MRRSSAPGSALAALLSSAIEAVGQAVHTQTRPALIEVDRGAAQRGLREGLLHIPRQFGVLSTTAAPTVSADGEKISMTRGPMTLVSTVTGSGITESLNGLLPTLPRLAENTAKRVQPLGRKTSVDEAWRGPCQHRT